MRITNHMAILRNLRNVVEAGVSEEHLNKISRALTDPSWSKGARRILPFRYVAAARACARFSSELSTALSRAVGYSDMLPGDTAVLVDVSGSMDAPLSNKSDLTRIDAAATLATVINAERLRVFTFSNSCVEVTGQLDPLRRIEAIKNSQLHSGTNLGAALQHLSGVRRQDRYGESYQTVEPVKMDRLIVVSDEQSSDFVAAPNCRTYLINVASYQHGVGYGEGFVHLDGFSEQVIRWVYEYERLPTT